MTAPIKTEIIEAIANEYITSKNLLKLKDLSEKFEIGFRTIKRYYSSGKWAEKREKYWEQKEAQTQAIAEVAEQSYYRDLAALQQSHLKTLKEPVKAAQSFFLLANDLIAQSLKKTSNLEKGSKEREAATRESADFVKSLASAMNTYSLVLDRSVRLQADLTGMFAIASDDAVMQRITSLGYVAVKQEDLDKMEQAYKQVNGMTTVDG